MQPEEFIATLERFLRPPNSSQPTTGQRNAVCLIRLDQLGQINNSIGYESAGLLLEEFNHRVRSFTRVQDLAIPLERHKVGVLLRGISNEEHITLAAAKLERLFNDPIEVLGEAIRVRVNAGFVLTPEQGPPENQAGMENLLQRAELALQHARDHQLPTYVSDEQNSTVERDDWGLEKDIEVALEQGEFVLFYQPKIHASYGNVVGAEALIRWQSPERGLVSPNEFIPLAEHSSLIRPLTWFAIKAALAHCSRWEGMGVSINIAPGLLRDNEIVRVVRDAMAIHGALDGQVTLEITESAIMENAQQAFQILEALRREGARISIDDFGTGYSSFAQFRSIPADELKIDRSFIQNLHESKADADIVKVIIDLAHRFSMKVVAEGIEDEKTAKLLKDQGCDYLQGYWISKPLPVEEFERWLKPH